MPMIVNFLDRFMPDAPVCNVCNTRHHNRVANILEGITGVGCRIEKPTGAEGHGWRIVIDGSSDAGSGTDGALPSGYASPMLPPGGSAGAVLVKASANDYDVTWADTVEVENA